MRQLSTLLLSLLLCATCLAQPDSRPGPYQATLAKINALLVGGAATVKEIEFTTDGSALASSSKSQIYADGNAGNIFINVPTLKYEQHRVAGAGLLSLGRASSTQGNTAWAIGPYAANGALSATSPGIYAIATSIISNVPSGSAYLLNFADTQKYRFAAALAEFDRLSLGGTIGSSVDGGAGSLALTNRVQFTGAGTADSTKSIIYASAADGDISISVPSSKYVELRIAGFATYTFGYSSNLATTGANVFQIGDGSGSYIQSDGFGLLHRVSNTYAHTFKVDTTDVGHFDSNGLTVTKIMVTTSQSPASNGTGTAGQIAWDANYIYVCTATNTWKRAALTGGY